MANHFKPFQVLVQNHVVVGGVGVDHWKGLLRFELQSMQYGVFAFCVRHLVLRQLLTTDTTPLLCDSPKICAQEKFAAIPSRWWNKRAETTAMGASISQLLFLVDVSHRQTMFKRFDESSGFNFHAVAGNGVGNRTNETIVTGNSVRILEKCCPIRQPFRLGSESSNGQTPK